MVMHLQSPKFTWKCVTRKALEEGGGARQKDSLLSFCRGDDDFLAWESVRGPREHVSMAVQPRIKWTREILKAHLANYHKTGTVSHVKFLGHIRMLNKPGDTVPVLW